MTSSSRLVGRIKAMKHRRGFRKQLSNIFRVLHEWMLFDTEN